MEHSVNMWYKNDKNIKFVVTRFVFFKLKMHKNPFSAGDPAGGAYLLVRLGHPSPFPFPPRRLGYQAPSTQIPGYASVSPLYKHYASNTSQ